ncbi:hypothetical protein KQI84_08650 [bacterium]|nr:hypothetical protein [bacterium]
MLLETMQYKQCHLEEPHPVVVRMRLVAYQDARATDRKGPSGLKLPESVPATREDIESHFERLAQIEERRGNAVGAKYWRVISAIFIAGANPDLNFYLHRLNVSQSTVNVYRTTYQHGLPVPGTRRPGSRSEYARCSHVLRNYLRIRPAATLSDLHYQIREQTGKTIPLQTIGRWKKRLKD